MADQGLGTRRDTVNFLTINYTDRPGKSQVWPSFSFINPWLVNSVEETSRVEHGGLASPLLMRLGTHIAQNGDRIHMGCRWLCGRGGKVGTLGATLWLVFHFP
jgi:hypothetical protein